MKRKIKPLGRRNPEQRGGNVNHVALGGGGGGGGGALLSLSCRRGNREESQRGAEAGASSTGFGAEPQSPEAKVF